MFILSWKITLDNPVVVTLATGCLVNYSDINYAGIPATRLTELRYFTKASS